MYGLNSNNLHLQERRSQDHQYHRVGKVDKDYFQKLFPKVKQEDVELLEKDERPAVLIIRPDVFISHLKTKLVEMGIKNNEIYIKPICYIDYFRKPFIIGKEPEELFTKHNIFKEQNEIRIVVDTRRKEVQELFDTRCSYEYREN